jgi:cyclopropane-fatty-acyl-phospholipid synthase
VTHELLQLEADIASGSSRSRPSAIDRWTRTLIHARLAKLQSGSITLVDGSERTRLGDPGAALRATVRVDDQRFYRALALRGALGGAEAYMDGHWRCDDLSALIRILAVESGTTNGLNRGTARWRNPALAIFHALRRNTKSGSQRNIAAHYDLGNEFFQLFLDPTLTYSSGIFETPETTMEEASTAKYERLCQKLRLGPDDHVLEIGTGWGGFALHAAGRHGCRVTTTTISRRQYELACKRVEEARLADRIQVLLEDYRDLSGTYDKLVSIEMIEAVGHDQLETFFSVCGDRLKPDGVMVLQAITIPDNDFEEHSRSVDFIKRYIFPGGELVSVGAVNNAASRASGLRLSHLEDLTPHYAETLRRWRSRMFENLPRMRTLGLDDRFLRMWEFYLCYCEGGFDERSIGLMQAVLEKPGTRRAPVTGRLV